MTHEALFSDADKYRCCWPLGGCAGLPGLQSCTCALIVLWILALVVSQYQKERNRASRISEPRATIATGGGVIATAVT